MDGVAGIVANGGLWLAVPIAFAAGIVAFLSPCVLPLSPGYVSYITGLTGAELADPKGRRGQVLLGSVPQWTAKAKVTGKVKPDSLVDFRVYLDWNAGAAQAAAAITDPRIAAPPNVAPSRPTAWTP